MVALRQTDAYTFTLIADDSACQRTHQEPDVAGSAIHRRCNAFAAGRDAQFESQPTDARLILHSPLRHYDPSGKVAPLWQRFRCGQSFFHNAAPGRSGPPSRPLVARPGADGRLCPTSRPQPEAPSDSLRTLCIPLPNGCRSGGRATESRRQAPIPGVCPSVVDLIAHS